MKKQLLIVGIIVLLVCVGLSGCNENTKYCITAEKGYIEGIDYINMSESQLEELPKVKEAIITGEYVMITHEEYHTLLNSFGGTFCDIKYNDEYYMIGLLQLAR